MEQFPSNSQNLTAKVTKKDVRKKRVGKVITGEAIVAKPSIGKKFKQLFLGGEIKNASRYILVDVLMPALKNLAVDATVKGVERVVYGENAPRRSSIDSRSTRVSYNGIMGRIQTNDRGVMLPKQPPHYTRRDSRISVQEIILTSQGQAELVIDSLNEVIEKYEVATVADYYDLLELPSSHVDNDWGWIDITGTRVRQTRQGFVIDLPPAEHIPI